MCIRDRDTLRRIKDRLFDLTDDSNRSFHLSVTCGLIGNGLEEEIINFLEDFPKTKLVIIDTLQKVRDSKGSAGKAGMYGNDYDDISSIKRIANEHDISIILVHHLRKLKDGDDPFNEISGSTGITGAADTNYVLKRKRSSRDATLLACGRDVEYQELTLRFQDLKWELVERKNSEEIRKAEIPQFLFRVVEFMKNRTEWVGTATELIADCLLYTSIPEIFGTIVVIQTRNTIACLPDIKLSDFIFVIFVDQIINSRTVDTGNILCFGKQWAGNDISRHGRKISADGTNTIRLPVMIYNLKFFADRHSHSPAFSIVFYV